MVLTIFPCYNIHIQIKLTFIIDEENRSARSLCWQVLPGQQPMKNRFALRKFKKIPSIYYRPPPPQPLPPNTHTHTHTRTRHGWQEGKKILHKNCMVFTEPHVANACRGDGDVCRHRGILPRVG